MKHFSEDDLTLYYYGEARRPADVERHLDQCGSCAASYRAIAGALSLIVEPEVPDRSDLYGLEVWQRIRRRLPVQDPPPWIQWFTWNRLAVAASFAAICLAVGLTFVAGRLWPPRQAAPPAAAHAAGALGEANARARGAAIGDHLERSERVLVDLMNAQGASIDVSEEQKWAVDLVDANRLYRDAAARSGDGLVASVLDDLERNLLDVIHGPSTLTAAQLEQLRVRLDAAALLFKVRILHDELRERERAPAPPRKTT